MSIMDVDGKILYNTGASNISVALKEALNRGIANFTRGMLKNLTTRSINLQNCIFDEANLSCSYMPGSNLTNVSFERTNLTYANLEGSDLLNTSFEGSDLTSATVGELMTQWSADVAQKNQRLNCFIKEVLKADKIENCRFWTCVRFPPEIESEIILRGGILKYFHHDKSSFNEPGQEISWVDLTDSGNHTRVESSF